MALNKHWIKIRDRCNPEYLQGVNNFLDFAFSHSVVGDMIRCPCKKCRNVKFARRHEVKFHLLKNGILESYTIWHYHGDESIESEINEHEEEHPATHNDDDDDMVTMLYDTYGVAAMDTELNNVTDNDNQSDETLPEQPNAEAAKFYRLLRDADEKMYPGCKYSRLSSIVKLLHFKCLHHLSNNAFDTLLEILKELIPDGDKNLPDSYYNAKKYISDLGLSYVKIDVCENDCILYWREHAKASQCPICGSPRWKPGCGSSTGNKEIPQKVLRYFPLKPRLQRLYMSSKTASDMRWHKEKRKKDDGLMRHPADSPAWESFDTQHKLFAKDPRSVRLGLATDGFQPFGKMSSQHSIWPVVLFPYNLPPWMCMKQPYFMLTLLLPGPKCPGMDMDVYLQPLIDELKELWYVGVNTYDAHAKQNFTLRAAVLWTVSDFPAYADLSGWMTKGYMACPSCHKDTGSLSLRGSRKLCYMCHRRFLPTNHKWRRNIKSFDGTRENRYAPVPLSGDDVLDQFNMFEQRPFGKGIKRKYDTSNSVYNWRKKSIFFELPYWRTLKLRHNLDVMHIEKNVCDNVLGTIMNMKGKTKDTLKSRYDLVNMGIRPELHPISSGDKVKVPPACFTLSPDEKTTMCKFIMNLKVPDGYSSNISRCVNEKERKISGMKSHDCHVFLQQLLPLAIRGLLSKEVCEPLVELSAFFRDLCSTTLKEDDLVRLERQILITLCKLEMIFPPAFFDVMVHLPVHLAGEARLAGPVQYRWMYPIERYLYRLKSYVRNKAYPEGSIAEGYIADECLTFCSRYLQGIDTKFNQPARNDEFMVDPCSGGGLEIFEQVGRTLGSPVYSTTNIKEKSQAHTYVLNNCEEIVPFIEQFINEMPQRRNSTDFSEWLYQCVAQLHAGGSVGDGLLNLVHGPLGITRLYTGFIVNGFRFHTLKRQGMRKTQNSGVMVRGDNNSPEKEYYGILKEVYELQYVGNNHVFLFNCEWYDVHHRGTGYRIDNYGFTSLNVNRRLNTSEPFVLASQAEQVFYVEDINDQNWVVVMKIQPRDLYNMPSDDADNNEPYSDGEAYQQVNYDSNGHVQRPLDEDDVITALNRVDVISEEVPNDIALQVEREVAQGELDDEFINDCEIEEDREINDEYEDTDVESECSDD